MVLSSVLSLGINPSAWAIANMLQLARTVTILNIDIPLNVVEFLNTDNNYFSFIKIPYSSNMTSYIFSYDFIDYKLPSIDYQERYTKYDLETKLFISKFAETIYLVLAVYISLLVLFGLLKLIKRLIKCDLVLKVVNWGLHKVYYLLFIDILLRILLEFVLDLMMLAFLNFINYEIFWTGHIWTNSSVVLSFFFINFSLSVVWFVYIYYKKNPDKSMWYAGYNEFEVGINGKGKSVIFL